MITNKMIVAKANEVRPQLDDTMEPIKRLIDNHDLVFAVWQDRSQPDGVGTQIIKGRKTLTEVFTSGQSARVRWTAIPCIEEAQAVALQQVLGDTYQ
jgi:hypothetical protein